MTNQFQKPPSALFQFLFRFSTATSLIIFFTRYLKEPDVRLFVLAIAISAFTLGASFGNFRLRPDERQ